ncbi:MAG: response regulator transcription factor [Roseiflexaceae bacterium]
MTTILVADDQPDLRAMISLTLESAGFQVLSSGDGLEALAILQAQAVDLILADIAMPRMNGYQLYQRIRENPRWLAIPFIFLTARSLDSDIRYGKELGVDDYLTKPIEPEDLLATVHGRLRRALQLANLLVQPATPMPTDQRSIVVGRLRIDSGQHRAWMDDQLIDLSAREFTLLEYLARRADTMVSPQALIRVTHDLEIDDVEAGSLLRPMIRSLRRKLGYSVGEMGCIENVRGVGYRLIAPIDGQPKTSASL